MDCAIKRAHGIARRALEAEDSLLVRDTERLLARLSRHLDRQEESLLHETYRHGVVPADDPWRLAVDYLSPIGCERDETVHTRMLRYLLDPTAGHGPGCLRAFLAAAGVRCSVSRTSRALVAAESQAPLRLAGRVRCRFDLLIEIPGRRAAAVIVENKIDAAEGEMQLSRYEQASLRLFDHVRPRPRIVGILLNPDGRAPTTNEAAWKVVSYPVLAGRLWRAARRSVDPAARETVRRYAATLLHHVCRVPSPAERWAALDPAVRRYLTALKGASR